MKRIILIISVMVATLLIYWLIIYIISGPVVPTIRCGFGISDVRCLGYSDIISETGEFDVKIISNLPDGDYSFASSLDSEKNHIPCTCKEVSKCTVKKGEQFKIECVVPVNSLEKNLKYRVYLSMQYNNITYNGGLFINAV